MHKYIKTIDVSQNVGLWYSKTNVPPKCMDWYQQEKYHR